MVYCYADLSGSRLYVCIAAGHLEPRCAALLIVLAGTALGLVPAAAAQTLASTTGDRIPYRVDLPALAKISVNGPLLSAESGDFYVAVVASDMMGHVNVPVLPVSDTEARRVLTNFFMGSDSLLLGLLDESARQEDTELSNVVREIRTLGGQRAGYLRGSMECGCGHAMFIDLYLTVKDGIMYVLTFGGHGDNIVRDEPLMARIHHSFVLADAPPPAGPPTQRSSVIRRIERSR